MLYLKDCDVHRKENKKKNQEVKTRDKIQKALCISVIGALFGVRSQVMTSYAIYNSALYVECVRRHLP
jgi:hypothetical protein